MDSYFFSHKIQHTKINILVMDEDFRPINYRRTNARFKYSKPNETRSREYYHMPPLLNGPLIKINNNKKYQKEEERVTEIERANRILFEKMRNIKIKRGPYSQSEAHTKRRSISLRSMNNKTATTIHQDVATRGLQSINPRPSHRENEAVINKLTSKRHSSVPPMRFNKGNTKLLYRQTKQIDGKIYEIVAYMQNGQFWLKADEKDGHLSNYMRMQIQDFKKLEKHYLPNGIESLLNHIKIGEVIQLRGLDEEKFVQVENEEAEHRYQS